MTLFLYYCTCWKSFLIFNFARRTAIIAITVHSLFIELLHNIISPLISSQCSTLQSLQQRSRPRENRFSSGVSQLNQSAVRTRVRWICSWVSFRWDELLMRNCQYDQMISFFLSRRFPILLWALGLHTSRVHRHGDSECHDQLVRLWMLHARAHRRPEVLRNLHRRSSLYWTRELYSATCAIHVRLLETQSTSTHHSKE